MFLILYYRFSRAAVHTSAAVYACIRIYYVCGIAFADSADRAFIHASAAGYTGICNFISHDKPPKIYNRFSFNISSNKNQQFFAKLFKKILCKLLLSIVSKKSEIAVCFSTNGRNYRLLFAFYIMYNNYR